MSSSTSAQSTLRDYLHVVRRRKWVILQAAIVVPVAALAFSLHQQPRYQASAQVLLSQQDLGNQLTGTQDTSVYTPADRRAQTQADLARVPAVAQRAARAAHVAMSADALLAASTVTVGTNADMLNFSFENRDPELATRLASAYAHAYVAYRLTVDTTPIMAALHEVDAQIANLSPKGSLYDNLQDKATQLRTLAALKTANASVVRDTSTAVQTAPKIPRNVILGILLGLSLGVGLAFLREALDTRVRSAEAIGEGLHLPLLARLPEPAKHLRAENRLAMLAEPASVQSEAFRMLRSNIEFASLGKEASVVMVTSAQEQEGKSTTIANLAVAMARTGRRVALVDLDLRRPAIDRFFDVRDRPGITQVAVGAARLDEALGSISLDSHESPTPLDPAESLTAPSRGRDGIPVVGRLDVMAAGPIPPDPGEFIGTARMTEIL